MNGYLVVNLQPIHRYKTENRWGAKYPLTCFHTQSRFFNPAYSKSFLIVFSAVLIDFATA